MATHRLLMLDNLKEEKHVGVETKKEMTQNMSHLLLFGEAIYFRVTCVTTVNQKKEGKYTHVQEQKRPLTSTAF